MSEQASKRTMRAKDSKIVELRKRRGWTQEQLMASAGIESKKTISRAENGEFVFIKTMQAIADAFEVPLSEIANLVEPIPSTPGDGPGPGAFLENVPDPVSDWVGRESLLKAITREYCDRRGVTGLIGFGGEGKSSLARQWLKELLADPTLPRPYRVFWWPFADAGQVETFLETALVHTDGGPVNLERIRTTHGRVLHIAANLAEKPFLFVLDGLEAVQQTDGQLSNTGLCSLLRHFTEPGNQSFCLLTSRFPVVDLAGNPGYSPRNVDPLGPDEARALLQGVGVQGSDALLNDLVKDWGGHALTLRLLGSYLVEQPQGEARRFVDLHAPLKGEGYADRVHRVLRGYDACLSPAESAFLILFSAFRKPVKKTAFECVFRKPVAEPDALNASLTGLTNEAFYQLVEQLLRYRILHYDQNDGDYTVHPLIRDHYLEQLQAGTRQQQAATVHRLIKDYYLEVAGEEVLPNPTLKDLTPLLEAIHHACRSGAFDDAWQIAWERLSQRERLVITIQLGAYDTVLAAAGDFFPDGDLSREPLVSDPNARALLLRSISLSLRNLGRLRDAEPFFERTLMQLLENANYGHAAVVSLNLGEMYAQMGQLEKCAGKAREGQELARRAGDLPAAQAALSQQGWAAHLLGQEEQARLCFAARAAMQVDLVPDSPWLHTLSAIWFAWYLRDVGARDDARQVAESGLTICRQYRIPDDHSCFLSLLGELEAAAGRQDSAAERFEEAVKMARTVSIRSVLIEALMTRGRWAASRGEIQAARSDLTEALGFANVGEYRLHEADIRAGLAVVHRAAGDLPAARAEAERALTLGDAMNYARARQEANAILQSLPGKA